MNGQQLDVSPGQAEQCNAAVKTMLDQLVWWGRALDDARTARSYAT